MVCIHREHPQRLLEFLVECETNVANTSKAMFPGCFDVSISPETFRKVSQTLPTLL